MTPALAYSRFPGMGDLPGDSSHPNSPDYVEPSYGEDDAEGDVGRQLAEADEVGEMVCDVRRALPFLRSLTNIPPQHAQEYRLLLAKAEQMERMVQAQVRLFSMGEAA